MLDDTFPTVHTVSDGEEGRRFTQTPRLEFSDEGAVAVTSFQNRVINSSVETVANEWSTFGPIAGASRIFNYTIRYREYFPPTLGIPDTQYPGFSLWQGTIVTMFRSEIQWKMQTTVSELRLMTCAAIPPTRTAILLYAQNASSTPLAFNASMP